jgi:hypothetical protein
MLLMDAPLDGVSATCYFDDVLIETVARSDCGDDAHPYPVGDFNEDCVVDFNDYALLVANWLICTDVNCP